MFQNYKEDDAKSIKNGNVPYVTLFNLYERIFIQFFASYLTLEKTSDDEILRYREPTKAIVDQINAFLFDKHSENNQDSGEK